VAAVGFALQAAALGLGSALVLCVLGASVSSGSTSALLLAMVSGTLWGVFAVLTKGVIDRLDDGISAVLRTPELYTWAFVAIVVLGETLKTNDTWWFAFVLAIVAMVVATVALAPGAGAVHRPDGRRQDRRIA
jgi:drug/metabolite transporter (DMT)-like permease